MVERNPAVVAVGNKRGEERTGRLLGSRLRSRNCVRGLEIGVGSLVALIGLIAILVLRLMSKMRSVRRGSLLRCCR